MTGGEVGNGTGGARGREVGAATGGVVGNGAIRRGAGVAIVGATATTADRAAPVTL
jgi:hypothetical protein